MNILDHFKLDHEKEDHRTVLENIEKGVVFKGTNLWILVFAIFIASLGLNVNSTAVIIGAMLISPIMGPIMGMGMGMAVNDLPLLRRAAANYLFAAGVGLATSTLYFCITPINEAHSEILARTAPNVYDVLIALFGGFAGTLATASRQKGNVIPGVAIATALMPPLCTAGYGLASWQPGFFFGALYLFIINTVFIALATLLTARFLKFPYRAFPEPRLRKRAQRIIWAIALVTLLPSIYFAYDIIRQGRFRENAERFVALEAVFPNDYLLQKNIDPEQRRITLTFGGEYIEPARVDSLRAELPKYGLEDTELQVRQGFAYLNNEPDGKDHSLNLALAEKDAKIHRLNTRIDSLENPKREGERVYRELKALYPAVNSLVLEPVTTHTDTLVQTGWLALVHSGNRLPTPDREKIDGWLRTRTRQKTLQVHYTP